MNLSHVDVMLAEVGAIEDYVFAMKHDNEEQEKRRREQFKNRRKQQPGVKPDEPPRVLNPPERKVKGRAARILEKQAGKEGVALQRNHQAKEDNRHKQKASHRLKDDNLEAAQALKAALFGGDDKPVKTESATVKKENSDNIGDADAAAIIAPDSAMKKEEEDSSVEDKKEAKSGKKRALKEPEKKKKKAKTKVKSEDGVGDVDDDSDLFDAESSDDDDDDDDDDENIVPPVIISLDPEAAKRFKERIKTEKQKQLDDYSKNVEDKVRLHEAGWKDRYYSDKCKADDVAANGGREHMFRSYVMGLCWVMKYYYDGCPSWKWYYPFHYAPFASDLKNIERFQKDCNSFEMFAPFNPVEQLMAVLPSDSSHAIPKAARWLMLDEESPIMDFYPYDVPVDPNGKAMPWLWVVLLPFIDEERLLAALYVPVGIFLPALAEGIQPCF